MVTSRILLALDLPSADEAVTIAQRLKDHVAGFKIGLGLLMGPGPATTAALARIGLPVFVDAKLHDIPSQVEAAARRVGQYGARWLTVHASGGRTMMEAANEGMRSGAGGGDVGILAVTVLTSLEPGDVEKIAPGTTPGKLVSRLARAAADAGVEGVVCGVPELGVVADVAPGMVRVTPGIRPAAMDRADQRRSATPAEAVARGADYLVVGRPITAAANPVEAVARINEEIAGASRG
ncbi:MAG: orotidine-5'-phosphate decarboxylase [Acidimicrobiia bacterium]|nr:orotidine-5'-phosphate decarboxylase [Acidimicrobiia bacterium]